MTSLDVAADPALRARRAVFGPMTRFLNPLIRRLAGRPILPMVALVHHHGRRSGRTYATPVMIGAADSAFIIPLTFGSTSDWCRNTLVTGSASITWHGREYGADHPAIVDDAPIRAELSTAFDPVQRFLLRSMGTHRFLRLRITPRDTIAGGGRSAG